MLVLALGDFHIPYREVDLPVKFKKLLVPGKIQKVLCTGNLCQQEMYDYLKSISDDVLAVKGDMDDCSLTSSKIISIEGVKIGLIHGHQIAPFGDRKALSIVARQMNVDILVTGNTHKFEAFEEDGRFYINPGSATGAFTTCFDHQVIPSFVLMDIKETNVILYVYQLIDREVMVEKMEFSKSFNNAETA